MMGEARDTLAERDHLPGLGERGGDHAVDVDLKLCISALIAREVEGTPCPLEPSHGFVLGGLLVIVVGDRDRAASLEVGVVGFLGGVGEVRGGGRRPARGALDLQIEVLRIELRHHVAGMHRVADIDAAGDHLAGDPEAQIGLMARPHHTHELAARIRRLERDPLHLHRALGPGGGGGRLLAAGGQQRQQRDGGERAQLADGGNHGGAPSLICEN